MKRGDCIEQDGVSPAASAVTIASPAADPNAPGIRTWSAAALGDHRQGPPLDHSDALPARQARSRLYLSRIVQGATELIERDGIDMLTMAAVAKHAGLSTGGIYRRFPDKLALLRALKDTHLGTFEAFVIARIAEAPNRLEAVVRAFVAAHAEAFSLHPNVFRFIIAPNSDSLFLARGMAQIDAMELLLANAILRFRDEVGGADPEAKARFAFHQAFSLLSYRLRHPVSLHIPWDQVVDELVTALLGYLRSPGVDAISGGEQR
jgi:AcrR family transcriptional regulator